MRNLQLKIVLALLVALTCNKAWAVTATFQEGVSGYSGTKDAILQVSATNAYSTDAPQMRAIDFIPYILYFDITSIPTTATVSSATITLKVSEQNCTAETGRVRAIENPDNTPGFDTPVTASSGSNDYATWAYKDHGASTKWDSGGANSNFTDVDDNADEDTEAIAACSGYVTEDWVITNMVQGWVTTPNSNAGMVFSLADTGRVDIRGEYAVTSSDRPLLTVEYTDGGGDSVVNNVFRNISIRNMVVK